MSDGVMECNHDIQPKYFNCMIRMIRIMRLNTMEKFSSQYVFKHNSHLSRHFCLRLLLISRAKSFGENLRIDSNHYPNFMTGFAPQIARNLNQIETS